MREQRERELEDMVVDANDALGKALGRAQQAERAHREVSQRYSDAYAELSGLRADCLQAIAQATRWQRMYVEECRRRMQLEGAAGALVSDAWRHPLGEGRYQIDANEISALEAALSSSSAAPDGGG